MGEKLHTRLHVLPLPLTSLDTDVLRQRVSSRQEKMKPYTDSRRGAHVTFFKEEDRVRVRKPFHVPKAHSRYTKPLVIRKQVGPSTFLLSDGKKWHSSRLARYHAPASPETLTRSAPDAVSDNYTVPEPDLPDAMNSHTTPARVRRPPSWLEDFVT